jgi:hypothetical protein
MTHPQPSHGSYICTFADCPEREEIFKYSEKLAREGFCSLGARVNDFSYCTHPEGCKETESIYETLYCEVAVREGVCPRGFAR